MDDCVDEIVFVMTRILMAVVFILSVSFAIGAQEANPTPAATPTPSAEEVRLTEENRILELEKKKADLKKGIREDQQQPSATPLEGKTTVDDNVAIETQMVTYKAMSNVADNIGAQIQQKFS